MTISRAAVVMTICALGVGAGPAFVEAADRDWQFVGHRLSKPTRLFYFLDAASVARADPSVTFEWSVYGESPTVAGEDFGRWSEYRTLIDCAANTSQTLEIRQLRPDGTTYPDAPAFHPKGWNEVYPVTPAAPSNLFADLLCQRQSVKTLPIKGFTIPAAVAELVKQIP